MVTRSLLYSCVGSAKTVENLIQEFIRMTKPDEHMVTAHLHDHEARLRSFELCAEVISSINS